LRTGKTQRDGASGWGWEVSSADHNNLDELCSLFERSFGHSMPPEQWLWKYTGATRWGILVRSNGRAVAFYGGMPRQVCIYGQKQLAVQIGDVMVEPAYRRILARQGAFFRSAVVFAEKFVGAGKIYHCAYGFPSERHNRLGEKLGLYGRIGTLLEARWDAIPYRHHLMVTVRTLQEAQLNMATLLWEALSRDLADRVVLQRGINYLRHRFLEHPTVQYQLLLVRRRVTGRPLGLLVLRDHGQDLELLDMLGSLRNLPMLVQIARQVAGKLGRRQLYCWLTRPVAEAVETSSPQLTDLNLPLPTIIWQQQAELLHTCGHWWLMGGDTDFR